MTNTQTFEPAVNHVISLLLQTLRKLSDTLERSSLEQLQLQGLAATNEAMRLWIQETVQQRSDEIPEFVRVDGVVYRRHQEGRVQYHDLCGPLWINRSTYRRTDKRNGETIVPLDLAEGMIRRTTPVMALAVMHCHANSTPRAVHKDMQAVHRCPPSVATLDRLGRGLGNDFKQAIPEIEPVVRSEEEIFDEARGLSVGLDRTTVPMAEGEGTDVHVRYRMAYVGTVSMTDSEGNSLKSWRYGAAAHEGPHDIIKRMMADVRRVLSVKPGLPIVLVQDGADEMWNLTRAGLRAEPMVGTWREVIDWYHLTERLAKIVELMEPEEQRREKLLDRWKASLLKNDRAVYRIIGAMNAHQLIHRSKAMSDHLTYFINSPKMQYASVRAEGLPIGSGVTEGACKSLVAIRAKRSGQRWRQRGIDAVLALRSTEQSDRLASSWPRFAKRFTASICAA